MEKSNFCLGKRKRSDAALQIYSTVNGITDFLHGAAPSAMKIEGAGIQWGCYTGVFLIALSPLINPNA